MFYLRNKARVFEFIAEYLRGGEKLFEIEMPKRFK